MKNKILVFLLFASLLYGSCTLYGVNKVPYLIEGEITFEESSDYKNAGLNICLYNKSETAITGFTLVFFIYDQDGNVPSIGKNNIAINISVPVEAGNKMECCVSMDNFIYEIPEVPYMVDYLYLSKIQYADGSIWTDPFGMCAFK